MIKELDIDIDGALIDCSIDFEYYKDNNEVTIRINSIKSGTMEVSDLINPKDIDDIKYKCQDHYERYSFDYWEQRYEERNSGLSRD